METQTKTIPPKPKRRFIPNVRVGDGGLDCEALRRLAEGSPEAFAQRTEELIESGELTLEKVRNLPKLFNALADVDVPARFEIAGQMRTIMASAFPVLTGSLVVAGINAAYDAVPTIGQELVSEIEDNKRVTEFVGITSEDTQIDRVDEGKDFPIIGAGEERYEIRHKRNGRRLQITAEMLEENDMAGILERVNALGEIANEFVEEQTLRRVYDYDGSKSSPAEPYVLRPQGAGTALYSTTVNTPGTRAPLGTRINNNALVDNTDLEAARERLAAMTNSRGKRISIPMSRCTLLVPDALAGVALKQLNSELEPSIENEINLWGPRGKYRPRFLSSPKLDDLSSGAWHLGWFDRQFKRKWKLRFEYVTLTDVTETYLKSRIAFQARIAWDCEIGAIYYNYVVQNLAATTAPADE